ncbi:MAG: hypothetical protein K2N23_00265 [Clostridia bacterium]|nr:hypothetical protein [Clostridia bacterium]
MERLTKSRGGKFGGFIEPDGRERNYLPPERIGVLLDRLTELEDNLESGQLVELPCKIHDKLFTHKKVFGKWQIEELECWGFHSDGRNILFIDCQNAITASSNSLRAFRVEDFGKVVFTDKTQAEAHLKELKEGI